MWQLIRVIFSAFNFEDNDTIFFTQLHNLSGDTATNYTQMNFLVSFTFRKSDNQFRFFVFHVHIFKDKDMQILLCIPQVSLHLQFNFHLKIPTP